MAKIAPAPAKQPVRAPSAPKVGAGFGMANLQAQEKMGNTLQQISVQAGAISTAYAEKYKNSEMQSDELNYRAKKLELLAKADDAASRTANNEEIKGIYRDAQDSIDKWVTGGDNSGNPNIRWKDQVSSIRGDATNFRVQLDAQKMDRLTKLSQATTSARNNNSYNVAIAAHDIAGAKASSAAMVAAGDITSEHAEVLNDKAQMEITKLDVADYETQKQQAINTNDPDLFADALYKMVDALAITEQQAEEQIGTFDRQVDTSLATGLINDLRHHFDGTPEEIIAESKRVYEVLGEFENLPKKSWYQSQADAVGNRAKGASVKQRKKIYDKAYERAMDGSFVAEDFVAITTSLGGTREQGQQLAAHAIAGAEIAAMDSDELTAIQSEVAQYSEGDQTPAEAMRAIKAHASDYAEGFSGAQKKKAEAHATYMGMLQLSSIMYDKTEEESMAAMYDANIFSKQKGAKQTGVLADGTRMISDYLAIGGSDVAWVKKTNKKIWQLNERKADMTQEEITAEMNAIFQSKGIDVFQKSYTFEKSIDEQFEEMEADTKMRNRLKKLPPGAVPVAH